MRYEALPCNDALFEMEAKEECGEFLIGIHPIFPEYPDFSMRDKRTKVGQQRHHVTLPTMLKFSYESIAKQLLRIPGVKTYIPGKLTASTAPRGVPNAAWPCRSSRRAGPTH